MTEQEIEVILRQLDTLRPTKDAPMEERIKLLVQRRALRRQINGRRIRGNVEELLREVNELYASGVRQNRIKESARVIRSQLLWAAIEISTSPPGQPLCPTTLSMFLISLLYRPCCNEL
jgi:hypothetical protein